MITKLDIYDLHNSEMSKSDKKEKRLERKERKEKIKTEKKMQFYKKLILKNFKKEIVYKIKKGIEIGDSYVYLNWYECSTGLLGYKNPSNYDSIPSFVINGLFWFISKQVHDHKRTERRIIEVYFRNYLEESELTFRMDEGSHRIRIEIPKAHECSQ